MPTPDPLREQPDPLGRGPGPGGAPIPPRPLEPAFPGFTTNFGRRLRDVLGDQSGRLSSILQNIFRGEGGDALRGLVHGGRFNAPDLRRLIGSGLAGPQQQRFLEGLLGRFRTSKQQQAGGETEPGGGGPHGTSGALEGRIGEVLNSLLNRRDVNALPDELRSAMIAQLMEIFESPGFPPELLQGLQNQARTASATRERERLLRRSGEFNARGLFGSGPQVRALEDIEMEESEDLLNAMNQIGFANAQAAIQQIQNALQGTGMLGQLGLGEEQLASNELLRALQLSIGRELGLGDLGLREQQFGLERAIQELLMNLNLLSGFTGTGGGGEATSGGGNASPFTGGAPDFLFRRNLTQ